MRKYDYEKCLKSPKINILHTQPKLHFQIGKVLQQKDDRKTLKTDDFFYPNWQETKLIIN